MSRDGLAIGRRDVMLEAIAACAQELLRTRDVTSSIAKVLELIGVATDVERVHMLVSQAENSLDAPDIYDHYAWSAPGISPPSEPPRRAKGSGLAELGLASWLPRLKQGEVLSGNTRDFDAPARAFLEQNGILSTAAVPIFVERVWWGIIAFDACRGERTWQQTEIDALKILAELVGAAVRGARRLRRLDDANRIIENSPTVLFRLGPVAPFPLLYLSQNARQYGHEADQLLSTPRTWAGLLDPMDAARGHANIKAMIAGDHLADRQEFKILRPDGREVWFEGEAHAVRSEAGEVTAIEGMITDVTERHLANQKLATLARTDPLTNLANRTAFLERLRLEFARARRGRADFTVLYLDLDHFKDVNDTFGHEIGDDLLRRVANTLTDSVRETDLVSRFGGDEFAVLLEGGADIVEIEGIAAAIGKRIAIPLHIGGNAIHETASIGIVRYDPAIDGPEQMLRKADLALYRAKTEGRNQYRLHIAELDEQAHERMTMSHDLRGAIDRGEFELVYQPQIELATGTIIALEALLRWNHPGRGRLEPAAFVPTAEANGTMPALGRWVLDAACAQVRQWRALNKVPPVVAVNISAVQFRGEGNLDRVVASALARHGLKAGDIELELTETVLMEATQRHRASFDRLRHVGVALAIDDFGTGFSSLAYLTSFRVQRLKLAGGFVECAVSNPADAAIVRAILGLAHELGIDLVAEGITTAEQAALPVTAGCRFGQGAHFGPPLAAGQLAAHLSDAAREAPH